MFCLAEIIPVFNMRYMWQFPLTYGVDKESHCVRFSMKDSLLQDVSFDGNHSSSQHTLHMTSFFNLGVDKESDYMRVLFFYWNSCRHVCCLNLVNSIEKEWQGIQWSRSERGDSMPAARRPSIAPRSTLFMMNMYRLELLERISIHSSIKFWSQK